MEVWFNQKEAREKILAVGDTSRNKKEIGKPSRIRFFQAIEL